jgi:hypothetical protein
MLNTTCATEQGAVLTSAASPDDWLDVERAAKHAGDVSCGLLYREIRAGRLRAVRLGGRRAVRLRRGWIDAWLLGEPAR